MMILIEQKLSPDNCRPETVGRIKERSDDAPAMATCKTFSAGTALRLVRPTTTTLPHEIEASKHMATFPRSAWLGIVFAMATLSTSQAEDPDRFEARVQRVGDKVMPYRLFRAKDDDKSRRYPLILFLHGSGERGDNNTSQVKHNFPSLFISDEGQKQNPCFVVAPQCPKGVGWSEGRLVRLKAIVDSLCEEFPIDRNRLYLIGLSMGGRGTFNMLAEYPGLFAAAVPCAGGNDIARINEMKKTPMWLHCSSDDRSINYHRDLINALKQQGEDIVWFKSKKDWSEPNIPWANVVAHEKSNRRFLFCEISDGQHQHSWTTAWKNPQMPVWLFSWSKESHANSKGR